jgi:Tse2 ADP-ribosyltransferase toxins
VLANLFRPNGAVSVVASTKADQSEEKTHQAELAQVDASVRVGEKHHGARIERFGRQRNAGWVIAEILNCTFVMGLLSGDGRAGAEAPLRRSRWSFRSRSRVSSGSEETHEHARGYHPGAGRRLESVSHDTDGDTVARTSHRWGNNRNPLYPDLKERELPNGEIRLPDVATYKDRATNKTRVKAEEGRGTSSVDQLGIFGHRSWEYVMIPKGTRIPDALITTKDHYMPRKKCWHYSISPNQDMSEDEFLSSSRR